MQKIDFVTALKVIVEKLQSRKIVEIFKAGFQKSSENFAYHEIIPILFLSKSNYDQMKSDTRYSEILNSLHVQDIYFENTLTHLTAALRRNVARDILLDNHAIDLFTLHNTLISTLSLTENILIKKGLYETIKHDIENGIVLFQILIEGEGLETEKYIKIFTALQDLVTTISKLFEEDQQKPEITVLDSGSDTNVGIKSGVETAKSLFLIFKEIWDYITSFKFYKQNQRNKALLESLSIREEIMKKIESGVLSKEEGMEYLHIIKTRTDDLIGMKVLPKQILLEKSEIENKKLLEGFEGVKLLGPSEQSKTSLE